MGSANRFGPEKDGATIMLLASPEFGQISKWPITRRGLPDWAHGDAPDPAHQKICSWRFLDSEFAMLDSTSVVQSLQSLGTGTFLGPPGLKCIRAHQGNPEGIPPLEALKNEVNLIPYSAGTSLAIGFRRFQTMGGILEEFFASWVYARRGPIASALKCAKDRDSSGSESAMAALSLLAWQPSLAALLRWIDRQMSGTVLLAAVPGRTDVAERLCRNLADLLAKEGRSVETRFDLLSRTSNDEMKEVEWSARERLAKRLYTSTGQRVPGATVVLVDDVITSGASLRRCGGLLRRAGARSVAAATLCAAPGDGTWTPRLQPTPHPILRPDHDAEIREWRQKLPDEKWLPRVVDAGVKPGDALLDCGCGAGTYSKLLLQAQVRVTGVDSDAAAVKMARENNPLAGDFLQGRLGCLPFQDRSFDHALLRYVVHHVPQDQLAAVLRDVQETLNRSGQVLIETSFHADLREHFDNEIFPRLAEICLSAYPDREVVTGALASAGFRVVREVPARRKESEFTTVAASLENSRRLVENGRGPSTWLMLNDQERREFHEARLRDIPRRFPSDRVPREWRGTLIVGHVDA